MPRLPLRIRNFQDEDLETLCEIDRICFPEDIAFTRAEFVSYLSHRNSITRVGEGHGAILGFVMAQIEVPYCAHIITLDVVPSARKHSIGTALMRTLHGELRRKDVAAAILEVSVRNIPAQRLYAKLNYQFVETMPGYYHGREDAYRMVLLLE